MVQINTANANDRVDMSNADLVEFNRDLSGTATNFDWFADNNATNPPIAEVDIHGSGFTYSGSGNAAELTGGTITSIAIDVGNDNPSENAGDLQITNTAALVGSNIDKDSAQSFWAEVLKGNDIIDLSGLDSDLVGVGANFVFGDALRPTSFGSGGDDRITASHNAFTLIGDVVTLAGAGPNTLSYFAGDDELTVSEANQAVTMAGDALAVGEFGNLTGGIDWIVQSNIGSASGVSLLAGEAAFQSGGRIIGAADTITTERSSTVVAGDVGTHSGGVMLGGDDLIVQLSSSVDAATRIAGDANIVTAAVTQFVSGGSDEIIGSNGARPDNISGDVFERLSASHSMFGGSDFISGGAGDDNLFGEVAIGSLAGILGGNDVLLGGLGNDELFGQTGDDLLEGGRGDDLLDGGDGIDTITYASATGGVSTIDLSRTSGQFTGDDGRDTLAGIENAIGSRFRDTFRDSSVDNYIDGGNGDDRITSGLGDDTLIGGGGIDTIDYSPQTTPVTVDLAARTASGAGIGSDQLLLFEDAIGGRVDDTLRGTSGANSLNGLLGADTMEGGAGGDSYFVDNVGDQIIEADIAGDIDTVQSSISFTLGQFVENLLLSGLAPINGTGNGLVNRLTGNLADNALTGGGGIDTLNGGSGNDTYVLEADLDTINDFNGFDTISATVTRSLATYATVERLVLAGSADIDGAGNGLNNVLFGNDGRNRLAGGDGVDTLVGRLGRDILTGGAQNDIFDFNTAAETGINVNTRDAITDFTQGQDRIDLATIDANGAAAGDQFSFLAGNGAAFTGAAGQLRFFQIDNPTGVDQTIVEGDIDGNAAADFQIQLTGLFNLAATDFNL